MDLQPYVVREGCAVTGTGVVVMDESGAAHLAPNTPFPDPREAARKIPLRYNGFDREWDGAWADVVGRFAHGGVDVDSVQRFDRPAFPGEATVLVTYPDSPGWTRDELLTVAGDTDLHTTRDPIYGSGARRDKNGTDTLTLDCLYIDEPLAQWLGHPHPGDIEIRSALVPCSVNDVTPGAGQYGRAR
ncbi:hypothetical protein [Rhodococcus sp. NBC_00294]|uniref:hypothetical protein n=1 Tax=Rhodococcus sp. NBC_00294 TaxID=2976004 RepID=UPI002E2BCEE7|nr:hypothetical protein [Rhodococcus sp. NBC_00294]